MAEVSKDSTGHATNEDGVLESSNASIADPPAAGQTVVHEAEVYTTVNEGLAYILIPPNAPILTDPKISLEGNAPSQSVFYNPIQQFNRDMTVLAMRAFGQDFVQTKGAKLEKQRKQRQKKFERKKKHIQGPEGVGSPSSKRRKLDSETADAVSASVEGTESGTSTAHRTLNNLDDDDLMDEDFLACERSALQNATAGPTDGAGEVNVEDEGTKDKKTTLETGVDEVKSKVPFTVLDALSATGLRALRYAHELDFVTSITANDLSAKAVQSIELNIKHNKLEDKIKTATGNANAHMYQFVGQEGRGGPGPKYDVIDIDPYGTAVPFLDAAVQAVSDGGLLCVTCTDTSVFNSMGYLEKTFSLYGGLPVKGDHCHEVGLRLILHAITTAAAKYGIAIEPLLSLSIDYYARVFVRIRRSPAEVKFLGSKTALVYGCDHGCGAWNQQFLTRASKQEGKKSSFYKHSSAQGPTTSPRCEHCDSKMHISGPMYGGAIHNPAFLERMLALLPSLDHKVYKTLDRIEGMLETAQEEMQLFNAEDLFAKDAPAELVNNHGFAQLNEAAIDRHPFYVVPSSLARVIRCQAPSTSQLKGALRHAGYRAVRSHAKPGSIKTDAPWSALWHIMREWVRQKAPIREGALKEGMAGFRIMQAQQPHDGGNTAPSTPKPEPVQTDAEITKANGTSADGEKNGKPTESAERAKPSVVFDERLGRDKENRRLVRYQMNPRANWGPMARAK